MAVKTFEFHEQAGSDGFVHLAIPAGIPDQKFKVVLTLEPDVAASAADNGWPPGFFESICGKWVGEFEIESEGPPEERDWM